MQQKNFSIGLVYYSGEIFLLGCIQSLLAQSEKNFEILFRDNSADGSGKNFLEKNFPRAVEEKKIKIFSRKDPLGNTKNLWHSGGHNFLVSKMEGENYVCGSIDMRYAKNFLEILQQKISDPGYKNFSIFTGKILQMEKPSVNPAVAHTSQKSAIREYPLKGGFELLDSAGLQKKFFGKCWDRGQEKNENFFTIEEKIFGATGALFAIRADDIPMVQSTKELFDEKIFYKNDVDLAYRMQAEKTHTLFIPQIFAWHDRGIGKKSKKSVFIKQSSFEGQYWIWKKHLHTNFLEKFFGGIFVALQFFRLFAASPVKAIESWKKI